MVKRPQSIKNRVFGAVAKYFGLEVSQLSWKTKLVEDLGVESLDSMELASIIEEEFDIGVGTDSFGFKTVGDIVRHVKAAFKRSNAFSAKPA